MLLCKRVGQVNAKIVNPRDAAIDLNKVKRRQRIDHFQHHRAP